MPSKSGSYCSCTVAPLVRAALRQSNRLNEEHDHHHGGCLVAWGALGRSLLEHGLQCIECIEGCPLYKLYPAATFSNTLTCHVSNSGITLVAWHMVLQSFGLWMGWCLSAMHAQMIQHHWKSPFCGNCPRLSFVTYSRLINHHFPYSEWHPPKPKHPKNTKSGLSHIRNSNLLPSYSIPYCKCLHKPTICTSSS